MGSRDADNNKCLQDHHQNAKYQMEKLRQGSTERKELEDGLITKQRDRKGKERSSIIKAELPKLIMTKFSGTHNDWIKF